MTDIGVTLTLKNTRYSFFFNFQFLEEICTQCLNYKQRSKTNTHDSRSESIDIFRYAFI